MLNLNFTFLEIKQEVYKWTEHNKQFSIKRTIKIILYRALRWVMCVSRKWWFLYNKMRIGIQVETCCTYHSSCINRDTRNRYLTLQRAFALESLILVVYSNRFQEGWEREPTPHDQHRIISGLFVDRIHERSLWAGVSSTTRSRASLSMQHCFLCCYNGFHIRILSLSCKQVFMTITHNTRSMAPVVTNGRLALLWQHS